MTNELTAANDFQTRIFEKIRSSMGDLLTDEEMKKIVNAALEKALFAPVVEGSGYGRVEYPSLLVKLVKEQLATRIDAAVKAYMTEHPDAITTAINDVLGKSFTQIVTDYIDRKTYGPLQEFTRALQNKGIFL